MKFPFLASFLVFVIWLSYELHKSRKHEADALKEFWQKERDANSVRKKSLDSLAYITIPLERLPMDTALEHEEIQALADTIRRLSDEKIVNLTGISNTDLKLTYGTANITLLTAYDQNYTLLASTLYRWGQLLYREGYVSEAKQVLEFGIETGTDVSGNYRLLAQIYQTEGDTERLRKLRDKAQSLHSLMKTPILNALKDICHDAE
ncbi:MAG: hypothetical protein IJ711_06460 [Lachnospiraceae bacterium]|nr:hypothetical protein [Lachnospiraceae bacterium]